MKGGFIRVTVNTEQQHSNSAWDKSHKTSTTTTKNYRVIKIYIVQPLSQWVPFQGKQWFYWGKRKHSFGDVNCTNVLALLINTESFHTVNIIKAHNSRTQTWERSLKGRKLLRSLSLSYSPSYPFSAFGKGRVWFHGPISEDIYPSCLFYRLERTIAFDSSFPLPFPFPFLCIWRGG